MLDALMVSHSPLFWTNTSHHFTAPYPRTPWPKLSTQISQVATLWCVFRLLILQLHLCLQKGTSFQICFQLNIFDGSAAHSGHGQLPKRFHGYGMFGHRGTLSHKSRDSDLRLWATNGVWNMDEMIKHDEVYGWWNIVLGGACLLSGTSSRRKNKDKLETARAFKIGLCGSTAGWCISHLSSVLHPRHPCFFLFGHSSKSQHLFSGRIGIISILNSLRVETLLIGSTCPSMSQLFPSASIISWKFWSFSASVESTNWPEGCNELHHHSESLRVSELINPNLKNEHSLMFSEQTKRPHGKPPGESTARSKTSEFIWRVHDPNIRASLL